MKLWIRLMTDNRLKKDKVVFVNNITSLSDLEKAMRDICHDMDIPTPIILNSHFRNFINFHNAKFKQDDFVESLDYDMLIVEDCKE